MQPPQFRTGVVSPIECFREGWELIKDQYWLFVGITIVGMLLAGFSLYILYGAMFCGIYYCLQRKYDRQPFNFGDLFKGFEVFLPGFIVSLFFIVPQIILTIGNFVFQILMQTELRRSGDMRIFWTYFGIYMVIMMVLAIVMACFHALITFAFPLIMEYKMSGLDALKLSAKSAWGNIGGVVGLILCQIGLMFVGILVCYFGIFFVLPIPFAAFYVAYRKVFPSNQGSGFTDPPAPNEFRGAGQTY
jgi:hypothetical protein